MKVAAKRIIEQKRVEERKALFASITGGGKSPYLQVQTFKTTKDLKLPQIKNVPEETSKDASQDTTDDVSQNESENAIDEVTEVAVEA